MNVYTILRRLATASSIGGLLMVIIGIDILVSGELRSLVVLGNERYIVGGVFIIVGFLVLVMSVIGEKKNRKSMGSDSIDL